MRELDRIFSGETKTVLIRADGTSVPDPDLSASIILAGSFDPLHDGHRRLATAAEQVSGRPVVFEISIENVDKPDLPRADLEARLSQFSGFADVVVTRARLFSDKVALLPGTWFVVGHDTAVRLLDDRYQTDGDAASDLGRLMAAGTRFFVAGRVSADGIFLGLESIDIPAGLTAMFVPVPEAMFREDVSSTALRNQRKR